MQNGRWTCQNVANTIQNGRWTCPHVGNPMQNGRWTCQNVANTIQNGRWTCPHVVNPMQNGRWTCPNVANTMQNDKFKFQTVANTRQMVPAKKSKKNSQTCSKKNPKTISHPFQTPTTRGEGLMVVPCRKDLAAFPNQKRFRLKSLIRRSLAQSVLLPETLMST